MTQIGQKAPDFTLPRDGGGEISLAGLRPDIVVLFFYPKDDTPGCTTESIGFSEKYTAFKDAGAEIVGISKDPVSKHDKFKEKHNLSVILASDADSNTCERYGVWKEKKMYGKTFMGIERSTFLIAGDGTILKEWRKVKVPGHVDEVLQAVEALRS